MAETPQNQTSQQIPGYKLIEKLGSGGMATVYKAKQLSLDRIVAIKVLSQELTNRPGYVEQFYAEGRSAAKLNHPNIVAALDVGEAGGFHYFVMEYVEGQTVYDKLMDEVRIEEDEAVQILLETARGMEAAHRAGFVHRDIKPQNIMLTSRGAKLLDMGLARGVDDMDADQDEEQLQSGKRTVFGSPYYISPEQILNSSGVDFRADIYSLGATMYYMVTGQVPFDAPTPQEVMKKHIKEELTPPHKLNRRVSDEFEQVVRVCLAKKCDDRYDTTSDLVADLEALSIGELPLKAQIKLDEDLIEGEDEPVGTRLPPPPMTSVAQPGITQERSFWVAVIGWILAILFGVLWILSLIDD